MNSIVRQTMEELINIGALAKSVGIPADTLRTWERRYGFPQPERTPSGHRRYRTTVKRKLVRVRELLNYGYKPSTVLAWSVEDLDAALIAARSSDGEVATAVDVDLATAMVAVREYDGPGLERFFRRVWNDLPGMAFIDNVAGPFLDQLGEQWRRGNISVAHEHFASEYFITFLSTRWRPLAAVADGPLIVCATPAGERHVLGLHLVALALAMEGARLSFLGADVPACDLAAAVDQERAAALALSISGSMEPDLAVDELTRIRAAVDEVPIIVGGAGAPDTHPGVLVLRDLRAARDWAARLTRPD